MTDRRRRPPRVPPPDPAEAVLARALLRAEARASVLHPQGARWLLVRAVFQVASVVLLAAWAAGRLGWWVGQDGSSPVPVPVVVLVVAVAFAPFWPQLAKAVPVHRLPTRARLRSPWVGAVLHGSDHRVKAAQWPDENHDFAVLAVAARTSAIDRAWLFDRARVSPAQGTDSLAALEARGLVEGGGRWLGSSRLSVPVHVTRAGRRFLAEERRRLQEVAARPDPAASSEEADSDSL
ncbi:hypothetical protein [Oryzobacter telluris]|uniref:hypothetical protein n=1 Tax=Oryzobacter telluris TaxID=3149179 RepID=UPI00370DD878